ncbi:MAG: HD domain-containing phosphohydrolase [Acidobacteriota bacterium]
MTEKVLCVDDEPHILRGYQRNLGAEFHIDGAPGGEEALSMLVSQGPYAVVVSDLRMPGMDGIQLLAKVRETAPETICLMLTGQADLRTAIDAVNTGNVFRFLTKPCPHQPFSRALKAGIQQYRLVRAEKDLLKKTFKAAVTVLVNVLELANPFAFRRTAVATRYVQTLARQLEVPDAYQLEIASLLSQIGCITVPSSTLKRLHQDQDLTPREKRILETHPLVGSSLIANIPRLEEIARVIAYQDKHFDGSGLPDDSLKGQQIPLGARILKVALDLAALESAGFSRSQSLRQMKRREGWYDPAILRTLEVVSKGESNEVNHFVRVGELKPGMILGEDVFSKTKLLLVCHGTEVSPALIQPLRNVNLTVGIKEPISVVVPVRVGEVLHQ